jgi:SAM-dependent methyltransferase
MKQQWKWLNHWAEQIIDLRRVSRGLKGMGWYLSDLRRYGSLKEAEPIKLNNTWPQLHDRTTYTGIDAHYFYVNGWAIRKIFAQRPNLHVDIASQTIFVNLLSAAIPTIFIDFRPLRVNLSGLKSMAADILKLPFSSSSIDSLSCLHVAEHIGLGRYGDLLNPLGTQKAAEELSRVLRPQGNLYFAVPVGIPRLQFNSHRIFSAQTIRDYFSDLELLEFSGIDDFGNYKVNVPLTYFEKSNYACGFFWFQNK